MKVITAPESYILQTSEVPLFLAGGICKCPNWQQDIIKKLDDGNDIMNYLVVFNPRRDNFPIGDKFAARTQITWEYEALEKCEIFSMYFCAGESDQPICMYELGRNIARMQSRFPNDWEDRIIISVEDGYNREQDVIIQTQLATSSKVSVGCNMSADDLKEYHVRKIYKAFRKIF